MSLVEIKRVMQIADGALVVGAAALKVAGSAIGGVKTLSTKGIEAYQKLSLSTTNTTTTLQPTIAIKEQVLKIQQESLTLGRELGLPTQESLTIAALASANLYFTERPAITQQAMQTFASNPTPAALETLTRQLETEHQPLVTRSIGLAVRQASLEVGFPNSQTSTGADGTLRVISTDDCGRTLVTEIGTAIDRETTIATEVTGISDSSCAQVLDAFAKALEKAGVRSSQPDRKFTGGIAELSATQEFVRRQPVKAKAASTAQAKPSTQQRQVPKRQQNNQQL